MACLCKSFVPYFNETANKFLENQVILDLWRSGDYLEADYFGVFSWKFKNKITKDYEFICDQIKRNPDADIYSFFGVKGQANVWKQADIWHPLFSKIGKLIFEKLGLPDPTTLPTPPIYSNHWLAKKEIFDIYVSTLLKPVMELMDSDPEISGLCWNDSGYNVRSKASPEICQKIFGKEYYPYHPFVLERLMPTFVAMNKLKLIHV